MQTVRLHRIERNDQIAAEHELKVGVDTNHEDFDVEQLEAAELETAVRTMAAIQARRTKQKWAIAAVTLAILNGVLVWFWAWHDEIERSRHLKRGIMAIAKMQENQWLQLFNRDEAIQQLRLLEPVERFSEIYPPDTSRWSGAWDAGIAFAWARSGYLKWQVEGMSPGLEGELNRRIAVVRRLYPRFGEIEGLEGRKRLAILDKDGEPNYGWAMESFEAAITKGVADPFVYNNRGWCRLKLLRHENPKDYDDILKDFERALIQAIDRRNGDQHDIAFVTYLSNYRIAAALAIAYAESIGEKKWSAELAREIDAIFERTVPTLEEAAVSNQFSSSISSDLLLEATWCLEQWSLIRELRQSNYAGSGPEDLSVRRAKFVDILRRSCSTNYSSLESEAIKWRLQAMESAPGTAREQARRQTITAYIKLVHDLRRPEGIRQKGDRAKVEGLELDVETLKAHNRRVDDAGKR
jgi:hypothetical protein